MTISNFIPEIWAAALLEAYHSSAVVTPTVNHDYEGEAAKGNTVHITTITSPTIIDYKAANRTITPEDLSDTDLDLLIDQEKAFGFYVDDVDKKQAAGSFDAVTNDAGAALVEDAESYLMSQMLASGVTANRTGSTTATLTAAAVAGATSLETSVSIASGTTITVGYGPNVETVTTTAVSGSSSPYTLTVPALKYDHASGESVTTAGEISTFTEAYNALKSCRTALGNCKVPSAARFAVVNPDFSDLLLDPSGNLAKANEAGQASNLQNGAITGRLLGFSAVLETPLLNPGVPTVIGYQAAGAAFVSQMDTVEALRSPTKIADIVRGLHVYGTKIIRPTSVQVFASV